MKTKNIHSTPIDMQYVTKVHTDSIAHVGELVHAVDFDAPEGTDVYATCDGTVIAVKTDSSIGGTDQKYEDAGNYIEILHKHGEVSEYEHLAFGSAQVSVGDKVARGTKIAESGNTGWSACPHLHFMVYPKGQEYQTLEIAFEGLLDLNKSTGN